MKSENRFYVYIHRRKTDGAIFYVGKGTSYRSTEMYGRNSYWHKVANKHGWESQIIKNNMNETCSLSLEMAMIFSLKKSGCRLTNNTSGGEGVSGFRHTEESKRKMSIARKGNNHSWLKGKRIPDYMKVKMRDAKLGKKQSPEHAAKSRIAKLGKKQPESARKFTSELKSKPITRSDGLKFKSVKDAVEHMKIETGLPISQGNISTCARGGRKIAYGYKWSYDS